MEALDRSAKHENALLLLLITTGVLLIIVSTQIDHLISHEYSATLSGLGEAIMIAGLLGFIVDKGLKTTLARDALSFLVGWEVTPSLREAIKDIIRIPCIRKDFTVCYTLEKCDKLPGFVCLTSETRFSVENMTHKSEHYLFQSRVEQSRFPAVTAAGLQNATLAMSVADEKNQAGTRYTPNPLPGSDMLVSKHTVVIPGNNARWFATKRIQYYPENFFAVLDILAPACEGVTVIVTPTPFFDVKVRFGVDPDTEAQPQDGKWFNPAVHLPGQHVRIIWAPKV